MKFYKIEKVRKESLQYKLTIRTFNDVLGILKYNTDLLDIKQVLFEQL